MSDFVSEPGRHTQQKYSPLRAAVATSLIAAAIDVLWSLLRQPQIEVSDSGTLAAFATTLAVSLVCFLAGWFGALRPLTLVSRLTVDRSLAGWSAFILLSFTLLNGFDLLHVDAPSPRGVLAALAAAAAAGVAAYLVSRPGWSTHPSIAAAPLLVVAATCAYVLSNSAITSGSWMGRLGAGIAFLLLAAATVQLFRKTGAGLHSAFTLRAALILGAGGLAAFWLDPGGVLLTLQDGGFRSRSHAVPRVILITVDTLRRDALSVYNPTAHTPNFDRLAADSVVFRRAISPASWTLPSLASLMTGVPAHTHGLSPKDLFLSDAFPTLAEEMSGAGYRTGAVVENAWLGLEFGLSRGFTEYSRLPQPALAGCFGARLLGAALHSTEMLTTLALHWMGRHQGEDYFFWLHFLDPHVPYEPPSRFLPEQSPPAGMAESFRDHLAVRHGLKLSADQKEWVKTLYLGEVRLVDEQIGRILDYLNEQKIYDESLIILTSDHGEEFWDHGGYEHGHSVFDEVIGVPLMVKLPHSAQRGSVEDPVSTAAVLATILDVAQIDPGSLCGRVPSLRAHWEPSAAKGGPNYLLSRSDLYKGPKEAVLFGEHDQFKFIEEPKAGPGIVYDLSKDPAESQPLGDGAPEQEQGRLALEAVRRQCAELRRCYNPPEHGKQVDMDPETAKRLRSLGYIK